MTIQWTAKLKTVNGIDQIKFSVKNSETLNCINGVLELKEDEIIDGDIIDFLKMKLTSNIVLELEHEIYNINSTQ
jgi:hypothetical protein